MTYIIQRINDWCLERRIGRLYAALTKAWADNRHEDARRVWEQISALQASRSPASIARLERRMGVHHD